jgi:hypothetical protein
VAPAVVRSKLASVWSRDDPAAGSELVRQIGIAHNVLNNGLGLPRDENFVGIAFLTKEAVLQIGVQHKSVALKSIQNLADVYRVATPLSSGAGGHSARAARGTTPLLQSLEAAQHSDSQKLKQFWGESSALLPRNLLAFLALELGYGEAAGVQLCHQKGLLPARHGHQLHQLWQHRRGDRREGARGVLPQRVAHLVAGGKAARADGRRRRRQSGAS